MVRKSLGLAAAVGVACLAAASCELFGRGSTPPSSPSAADRWWAERVEEIPLEYLAVYAEAAEAHREKGTACTYVDPHGRSMFGKVGAEVRLPCPAPADVVARMREKAGTAPPTGHLPTAEDCRGCTPQEAERIWTEAAERVARKPRGGPVPAGAAGNGPTLVPALTGGRP